MRSLIAVPLLAGILGVIPLQAAVEEGIPLPVRKVVLYKSGVGYFEHTGEVRLGEPVELVLPSSQLDDVLKSLTVTGLDGGRVARVGYDSAAPLERRLGELPVDLASAENLVALLLELRGAEVELRAPGGPVRGRLASAELRRRQTARGAEEFVEVGVVTPDGELRAAELETAETLRFVQPSLAETLGRYLELMGSALEADVRRLRIQTIGSGRGRPSVSYTAEVPIWKTTYRIVLEEGRRPWLQGWAIVDNTTAMDWEDVELALVAGAPVSFVYRLSQPVYARRPVVPLPEGVHVEPQRHEPTLEERQLLPGPPAEGEAQRRPDFGVRPRESLAPEAETLADRMRRQAVELVARGQAVAEQFEYRLERPVTVRRNESVLLPIVQEEVKGEKVSLYNPAWGSRARLAVWLENTSALVLDGGSFTVVDGGAYAGEGLTETIHPGERRLLSYALDLGLEVKSDRGAGEERVERVEILRGILRFHRKRVERHVYTIRNRDSKPRTVIVEHPARAGWSVVGEPQPVESTANVHRFRVNVGARATAKLSVRQETPEQVTYKLAALTPDQLELWVRQRAVDPEIERALRRLLDKKGEIAGLDRELETLTRDIEEIFRDQERLRENLARLGTAPAEASLRQRYVEELERQEDRLRELRERKRQLEQERASAQRELDAMIEGLSLDRKANRSLRGTRPSE